MLSETSPEPASRLFTATIFASAAGIFFGIYFLFVDPEMAIRIATALMVGVVGLLSFLRHSIFYQSDQSRLGWAQENPQFQIEVGLANLSMGGAALAASLSRGGSQACDSMCFIAPYAGSLASNWEERAFSGENCKFYDIRPGLARIFSHRTSCRLSRGGLKGQTMK